MKTAEEWFKEFQSWPRNREHAMIRSIQADAIEHCLQTTTALLPDTTHAFRQLHRERIALLDKK